MVAPPLPPHSINVKLPLAPPPFAETLQSLVEESGPQGLIELANRGLGPAPGGKYRHWDTFRHAPPLKGFSAEAQWIAVKFARAAIRQTLPLRDRAGRPFVCSLPNVALEMLLAVDRKAAGSIHGSGQVLNPATRDTYLFKSIVEEAIASSQLEGASTTRNVAKAMIQDGREPVTRSERMILNNYRAMRRVLELVDSPLTPDAVMALHRIVTEGTLDDEGAAGRFRHAEEDIVIEDETGTRLHTPPDARELATRMRAMCDFANGGGDGEFMPPAVRSILLHLWLAYDHPFVDGNGRTARALFYWSMARQGFWLCEYVSISRILRQARGQYARAFLYTASDDNDATYFILYQLRVLLRAIDELHAYLARRSTALHEAESTLRRSLAVDLDLNSRQLALVTHALKRPDARYTIQSHRRSHDVSYQTARTDLLALVAKELLQQHKSGRAFVFLPAEALRAHMNARIR